MNKVHWVGLIVVLCWISLSVIILFTGVYFNSSLLKLMWITYHTIMVWEFSAKMSPVIKKLKEDGKNN